MEFDELYQNANQAPFEMGIPQEKLNLLVLSLLLGIVIPICITNIGDAFINKRVLHISNAVHTLLYITFAFTTVFFGVARPTNCIFYRYVQAILFQLYLLAYEFTLAYKSKVIIGRKRAYRTITYADIFFVITLLCRLITAAGTISTLTIGPSVNQHQPCSAIYQSTWMGISSALRNINDLFWSLFFIIPIYNVLASSQQFKYFSSVNRMPYRNIFVANCLYPLVAFIINVSITFYMLFCSPNIQLQPLLYGIQNFVSTYQMNLILNLKVSDRGARRQPSMGGKSDFSSVGKSGQGEEGDVGQGLGNEKKVVDSDSFYRAFFNLPNQRDVLNVGTDEVHHERVTMAMDHTWEMNQANGKFRLNRNSFGQNSIFSDMQHNSLDSNGNVNSTLPFTMPKGRKYSNIHLNMNSKPVGRSSMMFPQESSANERSSQVIPTMPQKAMGKR